DTQLKDLVKFTNFKDSTEQVVRRPDLTGFAMDLRLNIDEQAHIKTILNPEHTNYIDMIGGGGFNLSYDPTNGAQLRGRYTLNSGEMKYTMDVIPLRTFHIREGSYVDFTGDPMQPTLNIIATEAVRASVSSGEGNGKLVDFNCGVKLTKQFPKPSLEFIIEAPDDQEMENALKTKSLEERSKLAVTMLASGLYFDGENTSSANTAMNGALASFLQTQVNAITGRALSSMGLDLSANLETAADVNGSLHTDYTFKFSKRFLNNRLRIILGGRVSTGSTLSRDNGAYFDNFSLEYRLNKRETKYLKLYYEREAYDWLEGDLSEYGIGFLWRRKLARFKDIFRFKKDSVATPRTVVKDSLVNFVK
ncbi:MAG: translocation/assembly module TamB domain-containing protein, partial [Prevotella bivia]|nr:translocation/assembly module TamB domain-containing protein [Prevotella bivia]